MLSTLKSTSYLANESCLGNVLKIPLYSISLLVPFPCFFFAYVSIAVVTVHDSAEQRSGQETEIQWNEPQVRKVLWKEDGQAERAREPYN